MDLRSCGTRSCPRNRPRRLPRTARFDQLQESLEIARNVLTDRLNRLLEEGILERARNSERPERYEYRRSGKGRELNIALTGLRRWGTSI
jgi:DNA-binding HxlR family transcriptional regulator